MGYATNIAAAYHNNNNNNNTTKSLLKQAIADSDTDSRWRDAKKVVKGARDFCDFSITQNRFILKFLQLYGKYAPTRELVGQVVKTDKSNRRYLKHLDLKIRTPKEQDAMRQSTTTTTTTAKTIA